MEEYEKVDIFAKYTENVPVSINRFVNRKSEHGLRMDRFLRNDKVDKFSKTASWAFKC